MGTWKRYTTAGKQGQQRPTTHVEFGPGHSDGLDRRLLGEVANQRILDLGTGAGHSAVAMAKHGARVVAIDPVLDETQHVRAAAEVAEVHIEVHCNDLADLAFLPADSFDAVIAIHSLSTVVDIGRVFRQVHRLLKSDRPLVLTLPHPAALMVDPNDQTSVVSNYVDPEPLGENEHLTHRHGIGEVFTQLTRANFRVDTLLEPFNQTTTERADSQIPQSLIIRARKIGT